MKNNSEIASSIDRTANRGKQEVVRVLPQESVTVEVVEIPLKKTDELGKTESTPAANDDKSPKPPHPEENLPNYLRNFPPYAMFISSILEIEEFLLGLPQDALVLWDYDYTIRQPSSNVFSRQNNQERELFDFIIAQSANPHHLKAVVKKGNVDKVTEPELPALINKIQEKGIPTLGCTMQSPNFRKDVIAELEGFDMLFRKTSPTSTKKITFKQSKYLDLQRTGKPSPMYYKGVLFCGNRPKGQVTEAFMKETGFTPSMVILIDDKAKNHKSLKYFGDRTGIPVYGFMQHVTRVNNVIDTELLAYQYKHLREQEEWLPDDKATKRFKPGM